MGPAGAGTTRRAAERGRRGVLAGKEGPRAGAGGAKGRREGRTAWGLLGLRSAGVRRVAGGRNRPRLPKTCILSQGWARDVGKGQFDLKTPLGRSRDWISLVLADLKALGEGLTSFAAVLATFLRWKIALLKVSSVAFDAGN